MAKPTAAPMNRKMQAYGAKTMMPATSTTKPTNAIPMTAKGDVSGSVAGVGSKPSKAFRDGKY